MFGLTGTGYFDMVAYQKFNDHQMTDYIPTDADLAKSFATMPEGVIRLSTQVRGHGDTQALSDCYPSRRTHLRSLRGGTPMQSRAVLAKWIASLRSQ